MEPEVLLLDEPTANLDPANALRVEALLRRAAEEGRGVVLATHNLFQARRLGHRLLFLHRGEAVEEGPVAEVFAAPKDPRTQAFLRGSWSSDPGPCGPKPAWGPGQRFGVGAEEHREQG